jgi:hypothetical protein
LEAKALVAVLKVNFKKVGRAAEMIEDGDFVIQDSGTKRDIDLGKDWDLCFSPGQQVDMSMIFSRRGWIAGNLCPRCRSECEEAYEEDIKW